MLDAAHPTPDQGDISPDQQALLDQWQRDQENAREKALQDVQAAIQDNPTLRHLQSAAGDPVMWGAAMGIDMELQTNPKWAAAPVADRFAEVVVRLERHFGRDRIWQRPGR